MKVLRIVAWGIMLTVIVFLLWTVYAQKKCMQELESSRRGICVARYCGKPLPSPYSERELFKSTCDRLMSACERNRITGLEVYRSFLSLRNEPVSIRSAEAVGDEMLGMYYQSFLFAKDGLLKFEALEDFRNYACVNFNLAMYYGDMYVRRGQYELLSAIEYLVYDKYKSYEEDFRDRGLPDLEKIALDFKCQIIEHIESAEGFTRQAARHMVLLNTEYAEIMRPGCGLSRMSAIRLGRSYANGLVNVGYTPKWLDIEFPLE